MRRLFGAVLLRSVNRYSAETAAALRRRLAALGQLLLQ
jgi:hypothetical protein